MTATNYPLLDLFWTLLMFVGLVLWIWLLIFLFYDIFRSTDLSGAAKAAWVIIVLLAPVIGVLVYIIVRGRCMQEHLNEDLGRGPPRLA